MIDNGINMEFIKPSYDILDIPEPTEYMDVLKYLEKIGRICYKSEDRITDESCIQFCRNIRNRKHWAILEHYVFVLSINKEDYEDLIDLSYVNTCMYDGSNEYIDKIKFINITNWNDAVINNHPKLEYVVSGSATAFNKLWNCGYYNTAIENICGFLYNYFPEIMMKPDKYTSSNKIKDDISFISREELKSMPNEMRILHDTLSVKYITDRGITHEIVRSRPCSYAQESTRYCNYNKRGYQIIIPNWINETDQKLLLDNKKFLSYINNIDENNLCLNPDTYIYIKSIIDVISSYDKLTKSLSWSPQQARHLLPHGIKAEIIQTARLIEWKHFFSIRCQNDVHPQMRELTIPLLHDVQKLVPKIFDDITY